MKKTKTNWGLEQNSFPPSKRWMVDQDYTSSKELPEDARQFLNTFNQEYYRNYFTKETLHDDSQKTECYRTENSRNRDIFSKLSKNNMLDSTVLDVDGTEVDIFDTICDLNNGIDLDVLDFKLQTEKALKNGTKPPKEPSKDKYVNPKPIWVAVRNDKNSKFFDVKKIDNKTQQWTTDKTFSNLNDAKNRCIELNGDKNEK